MLLSETFPYLSYGSPSGVYYEKIHSSAIEDHIIEPIRTRSITIDPSEQVSVALIDNKYYLSSKGIQYQRDLTAISGTDEIVSAKVIDYGPSDIIKDRFTSIFGVSIEDYFKVSDHISETRNTKITNKLPTSEKFVGFVKSQPEVFLKTYVEQYSDSSHPQVPVLLGHSGVGKSAILKDIVNSTSSEWGYRLVTIKASSIDKSDLMGFISTGEVEIEGKREFIAQDAPMEDLLTTTDAFLETCRKTVLSVEDPSKLSGNEKKVYDKLRHLCKTPIMFWDEINRVEKGIMDQLMTLFNNKSLNDYTWKEAPIVTAANWVIDVDDPDALDDMYQVEVMDDPAKIDRFTPINVSHEDPSVISSAKRYLIDKYSKKFPLTSDLLNEAADKDAFYNPNFYETSANDTDNEFLKDNNLVFEGKFPTFRGWENVLQYLCSLQGAKPFRNMFYSLIGVKATDLLTDTIDFDDSLGSYSDLQSQILAESYNAGLPSLLTGKFGIAKTAKVDELCKKHGGKIHRIDLSTQDKTTLRGFPKKMSLTSVIIDYPDTKLCEKFEDFARENKSFPSYTTSFVPFDFRYKVEECLRTNTPLLVFYDEINRVDNITQSAVFDAISEHMIQGVDVSELAKRGLINIVAAGNVGEGYDVEALDAATMARFSCVRKDVIDKGDIKSFRTWAATDLSPLFFSALSEFSDNELIKFLNTEVDLDNSNISTKLTSFRSFETLNSYIIANQGFLANFASDDSRVEDEDLVTAIKNSHYLGASDRYGDGVNVEINNKLMPYSELPGYLEIINDQIEADSDLKEDIIDTIKETDQSLYSSYWIPNVLGGVSDNPFFQKLLRKVEEKILKKYLKINRSLESVSSKLLSGLSQSSVSLSRLKKLAIVEISSYYESQEDQTAVKTSKIAEDIAKVFSDISDVTPIPELSDLDKLRLTKIISEMISVPVDIDNDFSVIPTTVTVELGESKSCLDGSEIMGLLTSNSFECLSTTTYDYNLVADSMKICKSRIDFDEIPDFFYAINYLVPDIIIVFKKEQGTKFTLTDYMLNSECTVDCLGLEISTDSAANKVYTKLINYASRDEVPSPVLKFSDSSVGEFICRPAFLASSYNMNSYILTDMDEAQYKNLVDLVKGTDSTEWVTTFGDNSVELSESLSLFMSSNQVNRGGFLVSTSLPFFKKDLIMFSKFLNKCFK